MRNAFQVMILKFQTHLGQTHIKKKLQHETTPHQKENGIQSTKKYVVRNKSVNRTFKNFSALGFLEFSSVFHALQRKKKEKIDVREKH